MLEHIVVSPEVTVIRIAIGRKLGYSLEFKKKKSLIRLYVKFGHFWDAYSGVFEEMPIRDEDLFNCTSFRFRVEWILVGF